MPEQNKEYIRIDNFLGGWNTRDDEADSNLRPDVLVSGSQNLLLSQSRTETRTGYAKYNSSSPGSVSITSIHDGVNNLLATSSGGIVYSLSGGALTSQGSGLANVLIDWVSYKSLDICSDGSTLRKWNGSSLASLGGSPPSSIDGLQVYMNHVFAFDSAGTQLRFSAIEDPESWPASHGQHIERSSQENIQAIKAAQDRLVIFKDASIFHFIGFDINSFQFQRASQGTGCISHFSVVVVESSPNPQWNGMYWADRGGFYFSPNAGVTVLKISDPIQPSFDALDQTVLTAIVGANDREQNVVLWSVRASGSFNNRVYAWDYKFGVWHPEWTAMNFRSMATVKDSGRFRVYAGEANSTTGGFIYKVNQGSDDAGTAITGKGKTKIFSLTPMRRQKKLLREFATAHSAVNASLVIQAHYDRAASANNSQLIAMSGTTSGFVNYNQIVREAQFLFQENTSNIRMSILGVDIGFIPKEVD